MLPDVTAQCHLVQEQSSCSSTVDMIFIVRLASICNLQDWFCQTYIEYIRIVFRVNTIAIYRVGVGYTDHNNTNNRRFNFGELLIRNRGGQVQIRLLL